MNSFIVDFWSRIFEKLGYISIFLIARSLFPKLQASYRFVDAWVLAHVFMSFASVFIVAFSNVEWVSFVVVIYGSVRVVEITVYQINVLLFDEYRAKKKGQSYAVKGYRRLTLLLLHNYLEIIFWFSCSYIFFAGSFTFGWNDNVFLGAIYSSFITMSTFGNSNLSPKDSFGVAILLAQSFCGLFMTLLSLARVIAFLPSPESLDDFESNRPGRG